MHLRTRSFWILGSALLLLLALLAAFSTWIVRRGFHELEQSAARHDMDRARDVLALEMDRLDRVARDWANWADMHDFVRGQNPGFPNRELRDSVLANIAISDLLLLDTAHRVVYATGFDAATAQRRPADIALAETVLNDPSRLAGRSGLLLAGRPWLVSAHPVLRPEGTAPSAGLLVMARPADATLGGRLGSILRQPVQLASPSDAARLLDPRLADLLREAPVDDARLCEAGADSLLAGTVLADLLGQPALALQLTLPRDAYAHALRSHRALLWSLLLGILGAGFGAAWALDRFVFARLRERTGEPPPRDAARDAERRTEQEGFYQALHDLSPTGVVVEGEDGTILDVNEALCAAVGYTREELIGANVRKLVPHDRLAQVDADIARLLAGEELNHRVLNLRKDGRTCYMELREKAVRLPDGQRRIIAAANNVSERVEAEDRLKRSEDRYHRLFNTLISGFALHEIVCDESGRPVDYLFLDVNPAFTAMTGRRRDEVVGRRVSEVFPGTEPEWIERYGRVALTGRPEAFTSYTSAMNKHFSVIAYSPEPGHFAVNFVDVTEQKRAEDQLRLQGTALDSAANAIMIVDRSGHITWVNRAFTQLTGYERHEVEGRSPRILKSGRHTEEFYRDLWSSVLSGQLWRGDLVNRRKDGTVYMEEMTITPVLGEDGAVTHFVAIKQDITERRQLQQQLFQAQKMEGIGQLAGGIAHDFNNLLQAITGFSALLLEGLDPQSPHRQDVQEIDRAAKRASELTRQLLAFSRRQMIEPRVVDLNQLVENAEKMLRRLIGEDIQLICDLQPGLERVRVDPGQMEQVLMNLAVNARDAMPGGGRLTISTRSIVFLKEDTLLLTEARHGHFICLALSDTGLGMEKEVLDHIFEPFFSTKGTGKGTGLGLSVVYGIVRQHDGMIHVYSQVGEGTTFRLYLPVYEAQEPADAPADDEAPVADPLLRGHDERILLVEDEDGVREFAVRALRRYGYDVISAASSAEAIETFEREAGRIRLLFTDVVLPDRNGLELAEELRRRQPDLKLLFSSGYMDDKSRWPVIRDRGYRFLQKPYPVQDLLRVLRDALRA